MKMRRNFAFVLFLILIYLPAGAQGKRGRAIYGIDDDARLRAQIAPLWFNESTATALANKSFTASLDSGARVEVKASRNAAGNVTVSLAREENGKFSGWAAGSWAYTRTAAGEPVRLRFFPRADPYTYIQFRPFNHNKCQADFVVYDAYITRDWPVPGSLESLLTKPLRDILAGLEGAPLRYFEPLPDDYREIRELARKIRRNIGGLKLRYEDDGALNADGEYVFIKTGKPMGSAAGLNCSGFAKWVVDGILKPVTGKRLDIEPLKEPVGGRGTSYTAAHEEQRDPFFGLDWIRNLAASAGRALKGGEFGELSEYEVRAAPFSMTITRSGGANGGYNGASNGRFYPGFLSEAGFGIEGLGALLYTLAIDEPGRIYLGAVNNDLGPRPRMRQYFHVSVFIPYFDEAGTFHIALFESAGENSFNKFRTRYPGHYISLVRIEAGSAFDP
jgi:hypothetical protein